MSALGQSSLLVFLFQFNKKTSLGYKESEEAMEGCLRGTPGFEPCQEQGVREVAD